MKKINTSSDLFSFLDFLRENEEIEKQNKMSSKIRSSTAPEKRIKEEDEEEEEEGAEKDEKSEEKKDEKEKPAKDDTKDKGLPGAKTLAELPSVPPNNVQAKDVISRLKFIRAGTSLSDEKVQKSMTGYLASLSSDEAQNLWIYVDAIARIVLMGADSAEVESPETAKSVQGDRQDQERSQTKEKEKSSKEKVTIKADLPIVSPVIVGESVKRLPREVDVPLQNGKLVPYGSKKHVEDLEGRIQDLARIRSYQAQGSDSRYTLSQAINSLKAELRSAMRTYQKAHPKVEDNEQESSNQ